MAKALKIAGTALAVAGLAIVTGGAALGLGLALSTTAFGVSASALFAASMVANVGSSLLSAKPSAPTASAATADRLTVSIDPRTPRKTVFGTTAMATDLRDQELTDEQAYLHRFVVVASHRVAAIREIWFDDKLAWTAIGGAQGDFAGYLSVTPVLEGSAANAINISPRMGASRRFTGCAYVYLRYKLTGNGKKAESPFAGSVPSRVTIVGDGAFTYDPRLDSTVPGGSGPMRADDQATWAWNPSASRNPALQSLWYLLGWRINGKLAVGKGVPPARIDLASFITAANLCDEPVARAAGGTEPRYRSDGIFSEGDDPGAVQDNLKAAMNATLDDVDGRIRITVLHNDLAAPAGDLFTGDVLGAFTWKQSLDLPDRVNVVRGGYIDSSPTSLYQLVDFPEIRIASPDGIDRAQTVNLGMVQSASQAQRLAKLRLMRMLYAGTFTAVFNSTAWKYQKGDVIRLTFGPLGWSQKLFRIADMAIQVDGKVPMMLREEAAAIYAADNTDAAPVQAAAPTVYDPKLWPLVQGITEAGTTSTWDGVSGPGKPEDGATKGAPIGTNIGARPVADVLSGLDVNTAGLLAEALRQDDLVAAFDARTLVAGQPVGTAFLAFRDSATDPATGFASAADFRAIFAKNGAGTAYTMSLDRVLVSPEKSLATRLSDIGLVTDGATVSVKFLQDVFIGDGVSYAKAILRADANGIFGAFSIDVDGVARRAAIKLVADELTFVDPAGGNPVQALTYANGRWRLAGTIYAQRVEAESIKAGDIQSAAVSKTRYAIVPQDLYAPRNTPTTVISLTFHKDEPGTTLKITFFGMFGSPDDLQFTGAFLVDGATSYLAGSANLILDNQSSQARMTMTPFLFLEGLSAGDHTVAFTVTNQELDNIELTIRAGSVLEVTELKQAMI
ncbi:hypothetical protein [Sphingomonas adhaesiva]|uniref:hypothetical protein n=1 Tax=Sphingomonas adhaesiva TaxID=28212 RepID=UPI002FF85FDA